MDTSISVRVFEWRGELNCTVDRVGNTDHRKHAPRTRLASFSTSAFEGNSEVDAVLWATAEIAGLMILPASCPMCTISQALEWLSSMP